MVSRSATIAAFLSARLAPARPNAAKVDATPRIYVSARRPVAYASSRANPIPTAARTCAIRMENAVASRPVQAAPGGMGFAARDIRAVPPGNA